MVVKYILLDLLPSSTGPSFWRHLHEASEIQTVSCKQEDNIGGSVSLAELLREIFDMQKNKIINYQTVRSCKCTRLLFRPVDPDQTVPLLGCQCRKVLLCFTRFSRRHFLSLITTRRSRAETPSSSAGSNGERHTARLHGKSRRGDKRFAPPNQRRKFDEIKMIKNFFPGSNDVIRYSKSFRGDRSALRVAPQTSHFSSQSGTVLIFKCEQLSTISNM